MLRDHATCSPGSGSRSASTACSPTASFKTEHAVVRGVLAGPRLDGDRGPGHLLGRRPPQAPRLLRPRGRPAQPARRPRHGPARRAARASPHAHVGWLFIHTQRGRTDALRARPARRPGRPLGRPHVRALGGRRPRRRVPARLAIGGTLHDGAHRPAVGRRRADARPAPRHLLDQLAVPLLRPPARSRPKDESRNLLWLALPSRSARRGTTTTTPSRRRPPTACARWQIDPSALGDPRAGEGRARVGRRARSRPERQAAKRGPAREHRAAARRARRGAPRPAVHASASGTAPSCRHQRRRRPDVHRPLAAGARPRAARARPARHRPRLRRRRARRRRHRRGARAAGRLAAAADRRAGEGAARRGGGARRRACRRAAARARRPSCARAAAGTASRATSARSATTTTSRTSSSRSSSTSR